MWVPGVGGGGGGGAADRPAALVGSVGGVVEAYFFVVVAGRGRHQFREVPAVLVGKVHQVHQQVLQGVVVIAERNAVHQLLQVDEGPAAIGAEADGIEG